MTAQSTALGWEADLRVAARALDWPEVTRLAQAYVRQMRSSDQPMPPTQVRPILALLREHLRYDDLLCVADAALGQGLADVALGAGVADFTVRRQYAQALVDRGNPAAALLIYRSLADDPTVSAQEQVEARGGVGRCFKEMFLLHEAGQARARYLTLALAAYQGAFDEDRGRLWPGINVVALLLRAQRDGVGIPCHDPGAVATGIAAAILEAVEADVEPDAWKLAIACEAALAMDRNDEVINWGARFAADPDADAFKIASFLRQLVGLWQLDTVSAPGVALLPLLRSALLAQAGGSVVVHSQDVRASRMREGVGGDLERVLGAAEYRSLQWYQTGLERCRAVARIETLNEEGIGTGFLVAGSALHPALPDSVLVTNGHVVPEALDQMDAVVVFRGLDSDGGRNRFRIVRRWWYEPSASPGLDTTLVELDGCPGAVTPIPLARHLPDLHAANPPRAYLIGHPRGLERPQFSLQDNLLLDHDDRRLHYRSPTEGGSSGSPVLDGQWELIGVHHAGGVESAAAA